MTAVSILGNHTISRTVSTRCRITKNSPGSVWPRASCFRQIWLWPFSATVRSSTNVWSTAWPKWSLSSPQFSWLSRHWPWSLSAFASGNFAFSRPGCGQASSSSWSRPLPSFQFYLTTLQTLSRDLVFSDSPQRSFLVSWKSSLSSFLTSSLGFTKFELRSASIQFTKKDCQLRPREWPRSWRSTSTSTSNNSKQWNLINKRPGSKCQIFVNVKFRTILNNLYLLPYLICWINWKLLIWCPFFFVSL